MEYSELIKRLKNLYEDLLGTDLEADELFRELCNQYDNGKEELLDEYARLFSPVKTTPETGNSTGNPVDMTQLMLNFSEGYDEFVARLENTYRAALIKRRDAVDLFSKMVSLPFPEARLLFMTYYKRMSPEDIRKKLFISRATYFRSKRAAICNLQRIIDNRE
ncbi:MAG: DUF1492 domain-containing protein [Saccharofermentans sp.]|nr:DUF1492 domain-containing protein [Saccharofermentans sp.]